MDKYGTLHPFQVRVHVVTRHHALSHRVARVQVEGVAWLRSRWKADMNCILGT
jgi:hypothetical protein